MNNNPNLYILIGLPGVGKTTWVNSQFWKNDCVILSSDNLIEEYAKQNNKTYDEVFDEYINIAIKQINNDAIIARNNNKNVIWDQTNLTIKSRRKRMELFPNYNHIFVIFGTPEIEEHNRRLNSRIGKTISEDLLFKMKNSFEYPTWNENCNQIWYITKYFCK